MGHSHSMPKGTNNVYSSNGNGSSRTFPSMQQMPYNPNPYPPLSPAMPGSPFGGGGSVFGFAQQQQQASADPFAMYEYGVRGSIDQLRRSNTLNSNQLREVDAAEAELKQMMDLRRVIGERLKPFMQNLNVAGRSYAR